MKFRFSLPVLLLALMPFGGHAGQVSVAVASNFAAPMKQLAAQFEYATGHTVTISTGATGKFYAQIKNGALFDVFLAADDATPARLMREGDAVAKQTYAIGRLVLWSATPGYVTGNDDALRQSRFKRLAIANPRLAPYGAAAIEVLTRLKLADRVQPKLVVGENIAQTYQFVASGNAELGFVALSQVVRDGKLASGSAWLVPASLHVPIRQDAVLLRRGEQNEAARALFDFLKSPAAALTLTRSFGYER
ncbi:MAG: molybdate ABC transporter substrate-binding protein [Thiobacillus sp.]|nr:molybdate ABC transporter substrate-binding protein [Thiobacillus sp.]